MTALKSTSFVWILLLFFFFCKNTYSGIVVEPFFGGESGTWKSEESYPISDYDVTGTQRGIGLGLYYGSRVYISLLKAFFLGAGYYQTMNQWNVSDDPDTANDDSWKNVSATRKNINLFFGLQKPGSKGPLYKMWISFGVSETLALKEAHQPTKDAITYSGTSLSGGYSRPLKGWFYLNLEFSLISMNKRAQGGSEVIIPSSQNFETYNSFEFKTLLLSISMPLTFFKTKMGW